MSLPAGDPYDMSHGFAWIIDEAMAIILAEGMRIQDVRWGLDAKPGAVLQEHKLYFNFDNRRYSGSFSDEEIEQCAESAPDKERVRAAVSKRLLGELQKCLKG